MSQSRKCKEYFVVANSFAAPFFSDTSRFYVKGVNPLLALEKAVNEYKHPCGLYAANIFESADAEQKGEKRLAYYLSNLVIEQERLTKNLGGYSILHSSDEKGEFIEIDHKKHYIENPRGGKCFAEELPPSGRKGK